MIVRTDAEEIRDKEVAQPVTIFLNGLDDIGLLGKLSDVISNRLHANILKISLESKDGIFEGIVQVLLNSSSELGRIRKELKKIPNIRTVIRREE